MDTVEAHEAAREVPNAAMDAEAQKMFRYSAFIDIGPGAEGCEHSRDGECEDVEHFHVWCRLPNPLQHKDIRDKALAAKARKIRALRDPESDAFTIMDAELKSIEDESFRGVLIDELLQGEWAEDYIEAQRDTEELEEFQNLDQDRAEYRRLSEAEADLSEAERSDELRQLEKHMTHYLDVVRGRLVEIQRPKREAFAARTMESLIDVVRSQRIEEMATAAFIDTYNTWMWFVGTYKVDPHPTLKRPWRGAWEEIGRSDQAAPGTMLGESPEVIEALKKTYNDLSVSLQRGSAGN